MRKKKIRHGKMIRMNRRQIVPHRNRNVRNGSLHAKRLKPALHTDSPTLIHSRAGPMN